MNKREHEENISILKSIIPEYEMRNKTFGVKALRDAISALEKQIPKKPIEEQGISPRCPYCESANYLTNEDEEDNKFCGNCGQAIDWRDKDE